MVLWYGAMVLPYGAMRMGLCNVWYWGCGTSGRCCAMCGTEIAYAAMRCPVLMQHMVLRSVLSVVCYEPTPVLCDVRY
eukprot:2390077-Rhodomonas_salina.1